MSVSRARASSSADLSGRRVVVTGANTGIGFEEALALARRGAHVVLAVRNAERGAAAQQRITAAVPTADTSVELLDLASLESVRSFAGRMLAGPRIDVLVNNAGIMAVPLGRTAEGFELQFGTNHLGHFALTGLLLPHLAIPGTRVVTVSSIAHREGRIDFGNLDAEHGYSAWGSYQQSKLANLMFALELDRRMRSAGVGAISVAAHPGLAATDLFARTSQAHGWRWAQLAYPVLGRMFAQSSRAGAQPVVHAATAAEISGGEYFGPRVLELWGKPAHATVAARAQDPHVARRLWEESERRTGVTYDFGSGSSWGGGSRD